MNEPIWLSVARMSAGLAEIPGAQSNPVILQWAKDIGSPTWYHNDDQPWCAVFFNRVMLASQIPMALGTRGDAFDRLRALTVATWGQPLRAPALGAALVFSRPEGAHVGFYLGERPGFLRVFGGNQSNKVGETWIERSRLTAIRWAPGVPVPMRLEPIALAATGEPVSVNEA